MDKSERDVLRLLSDVYAAGLGDRGWADTLGAIARFFDAPCAVVFECDPQTGTIPAFLGYGTQPGEGDYVERMNAIDPRKKRALARRGCFTTYDYEVISEAEIRRHEFYDWMVRDCGLKYHVGSRMIDTDSVSAFVSVHFDAKRGHAEPGEIGMLELLTPHIANAWRMSRLLALASRIDDFNLLLLEHAPWGVVTLDHRGRVLTVNGPARRALERCDGLRTKRRRLRALRAADDRSLQIEIGRSLKSARGEGSHSGGAMAVGRCGGATPYGVRVIPMRHATGTMPEDAPFVAVLIADPVEPGLPAAEDVMAVFGLTPREAEVALLVAQGLPVAGAARRLAIAPGTARTHLAHAVSRSGARSQSALMALIRGLPARDE